MTTRITQDNESITILSYEGAAENQIQVTKLGDDVFNIELIDNWIGGSATSIILNKENLYEIIRWVSK